MKLSELKKLIREELSALNEGLNLNPQKPIVHNGIELAPIQGSQFKYDKRFKPLKSQSGVKAGDFIMIKHEAWWWMPVKIISRRSHPRKPRMFLFNVKFIDGSTEEVDLFSMYEIVDKEFTNAVKKYFSKI